MMKMENGKRHMIAAQLAENQQLSAEKLVSIKGGVTVEPELYGQWGKPLTPREHWSNFFYKTMGIP